LAKELKIKPKPGKAWYLHASGNNIECKERITAKIGFDRLRDEERFYIIPKGYRIIPRGYREETPVILGADIMSKLRPTINATDIVSTRSEDSGYGSGHSPRQSYQIPIRSMDNALSTASSSTPSYNPQSSFATPSTYYPGSQFQGSGSIQDATGILYSRERVASQGSAGFYRPDFPSADGSEANFNPADTSQEYQSSLPDNSAAHHRSDPNATSTEEGGARDYVPSSGTDYDCNADEQYTPRTEGPFEVLQASYLTPRPSPPTDSTRRPSYSSASSEY
jgi:hypothetical protein